jgi:SAM-dependent methyltransferase
MQVISLMTASIFDAVAHHYDAARPSYPDSLFAAIEESTGPLAGRLVLDGGAGTGIATRQLAARGARVVGYDIGAAMLRRAQARSPGLSLAICDGNRLPFLDGCADLACFAQSWHWLDHDRAAREVARVLRPGGHWAAWWNHPAADGEPWFDAYQDAMDAACPDYYRFQGSEDWTLEPLARTRLFEPGSRTVVPWTRTVTTTGWITNARSTSYVSALEPAARERLLAEVTGIISGRFTDGQMTIPYRTWAWIARRAAG